MHSLPTTTIRQHHRPLPGRIHLWLIALALFSSACVNQPADEPREMSLFEEGYRPFPALLPPPRVVDWPRLKEMKPPQKLSPQSKQFTSLKDDLVRSDLDRDVTLDIQNETLADAVRAIRSAAKTRIILRQDKIDLSRLRLITYKCERIPLRNALTEILKLAMPVNGAEPLAFHIEADFLVISTVYDLANAPMVVETWMYDTRWLAATYTHVNRTTDDSVAPADTASRIPLLAELERLITRQIAPGTWQNPNSETDKWRLDSSDAGTITTFNGTLIITHTPDVHAQIADLLAKLHTLHQ